MQIRDADIDDVREIQRVAWITWDHTYRDSIPEEVRTEFLCRAYSDESLLQRIVNDVFLVAVRDDEVFGFADFGTVSEGEAELAAIYVLPEMQGEGLGSRLLDAGLSKFSANTRFVLSVERQYEGETLLRGPGFSARSRARGRLPRARVPRHRDGLRTRAS